jgi:hemerythrin-like domain-containing protein
VLVRIGRRNVPGDLVEMLRECHVRIRHFAALADRAAAALEDAAVADAAASCARYFAEAFPLHVADEEQSLLPRLRGRDASLDAALDAMEQEHASHTATITGLVEAARLVALSPASRASRERLAAAAARAAHLLEPHLRAEEEIVFPAIDAYLDAATRTEIVHEMRARR